MKSSWINEVIIIQPDVGFADFTKSWKSNTRWDLSLKTPNVILIVAQLGNPGIRTHPVGIMNAAPILQRGSKWWMLTNSHSRAQSQRGSKDDQGCCGGWAVTIACAWLASTSRNPTYFSSLTLDWTITRQSKLVIITILMLMDSDMREIPKRSLLIDCRFIWLLFTISVLEMIPRHHPLPAHWIISNS